MNRRAGNIEYTRVKFVCGKRVRKRGTYRTCLTTVHVNAPRTVLESQTGYHRMCGGCGQMYAVTMNGAIMIDPASGVDAEGKEIQQ